MAEREPELSEMLARLERVEKENRRLKRGGLLVLLVAGIVVLMGQARPSRTVEAEKFTLKDKMGRVKATLEAPDGAPALELFDANGNVRASLKLEGNSLSPALDLYAANDDLRATLSTKEDGAVLSLFDNDGYRAQIGNNSEFLYLLRDKRHTTAASVVLFGKDGKVLWSAP